MPGACHDQGLGAGIAGCAARDQDYGTTEWAMNPAEDAHATATATDAYLRQSSDHVFFGRNGNGKVNHNHNHNRAANAHTHCDAHLQALSLTDFQLLSS